MYNLRNQSKQNILSESVTYLFVVTITQPGGLGTLILKIQKK